MEESKKLSSIIINKTVSSFKKNFFDVIVLDKKNDITTELKKIINKDAIIGYGGSRSLEEIDFFDTFNPSDYPNILDRQKQDITPEEKQELQHKALSADFFLSSANGVSQTGELILIDKWGNRNAAMTYGPKKRIFIIGQNKIEKDLQTALKRANNKASVLNNIRFDTKNPCTKNGVCIDCDSTNRLCSVTTIIHRAQPPKSILVILVKKNLGF